MSDEAVPGGRFDVPNDIDASANIRALFALYGPVFRWAATLTAMLGTFATLLSGTVINVAIPDVMGALGMTSERAQWLSTGFLAATTVSMLLAAWCVERIGVSRTYCLSMIIFLLGSVLGGISTSGDALIISRVIQGAGAGLMTPISMLIVFQVFPVRRRGTAMGIFSIGVVLAPALGPVVGGLLVDHLNWRYVFFMAMPFAMISIPLAMVFMPQRETTARSPRFDWTGAGLLSVFIVCLLVGLSHGPRDGWGDEGVAKLLLAAATAGIVFLFWEFRVTDPMFNLRLFANGRFFTAAIVTFVIGAGLFSTTFYLPLFMQTIQGLKPTDAGLLLLPAGLAMGMLFPFAGWLSDYVSPRRLIMCGVILFSISSLLMARADNNTPFLDLALWTLLGRIGMAFIYPCLSAAAMRPLPFHLLAHGSGMVSFLRQLGGAFGVNLLGNFLGRRAAFHADHLTATQTAGNQTTLELSRQLTENQGQIGWYGETDVGETLNFLGQMIWQQASMLAYRELFLTIAIFFALCLIPAWFMDSRVPPQGDSMRPAGSGLFGKEGV